MTAKKKKLVISTGAGISAESGMATYRDAGGLWDNYPVMQVASADGFERDPALIHSFYSNLRKKLVDIKPNAAHYGLKDLEQYFDVHIITQNVDDLHERAGSSNVLHLHGELMKVRSMTHPERIYDLSGGNLVTSIDTRDEYGDPVRPHIVFFQEDVPNFAICGNRHLACGLSGSRSHQLCAPRCANLLHRPAPGFSKLTSAHH